MKSSTQSSPNKLENKPPLMPWEMCRPNESDERLRILNRLAQKLLDNRMFEERERLINELARQEAELQHLREGMCEQMQKHEEQHLFIKNQEATMQQLKQKMMDRDLKEQDSSKCNEVLSKNLRQQLTELQTAKLEEARRYEMRIERLEEELQIAKRTALSNVHTGAQINAEEISMLRINEANLLRQLEQANSEIEMLRSDNQSRPSNGVNHGNTSFKIPLPDADGQHAFIDDDAQIEEVNEEFGSQPNSNDIPIVF